MQKQIDKEDLSANCEKIEEVRYMKRFTPEQITEMKDNLSETSIQINDIEEEKKIVVERFKDQLKPLIDDKKKLLTNIKQKAEFVTESCFKFIDYENKRAGWYNSEGELIEERPAYPDELQYSLPLNPANLKKTGTHN